MPINNFFILFLFRCIKGNAQEVAKSEARVYDISNIIPEELKATDDTKDKEIITYCEYNKAYDATFIMKAYVQKDELKIISLKAVSDRNDDFFVSLSRANAGCPKGYRDCARGCTDKPTIFGAGMCTVYCVIDCSGH